MHIGNVEVEIFFGIDLSFTIVFVDELVGFKGFFIVAVGFIGKGSCQKGEVIGVFLQKSYGNRLNSVIRVVMGLDQLRTLGKDLGGEAELFGSFGIIAWRD